MSNETDLQFYIEHRREERYLEYKCSMTWTGNNNTKVKIAKAMMGMSNLRNGGVIVVGMKEIQRGVWEPDSMTTQQVIKCLFCTPLGTPDKHALTQSPLIADAITRQKTVTRDGASKDLFGT